jgi:hypothetical protein
VTSSCTTHLGKLRPGSVGQKVSAGSTDDREAGLRIATKLMAAVDDPCES